MTESTKDSQLLIQLYNEVDAFMRQQYQQDKYADHSFLIQQLAPKNRTINRYQQEMRAIAQLRNSLIHSPFTHFDAPIAEPHPEVVKRYAYIHDVLLHPHTALDVAIPAQKIYTATLDANLVETIQKMNANIFTHVPVMEGDKLIGILSENTLLSYLADMGEGIITKDMTIGHLKAYLPLDAHTSEIFVFLPRQARLSQLFDVFSKAIHRHVRIGMVFITEHGKEDEKPLGIVTAWDLASPEFDLE